MVQIIFKTNTESLANLVAKDILCQQVNAIGVELREFIIEKLEQTIEPFWGERINLNQAVKLKFDKKTCKCEVTVEIRGAGAFEWHLLEQGWSNHTFNFKPRVKTEYPALTNTPSPFRPIILKAGGVPSGQRLGVKVTSGELSPNIGRYDYRSQEPTEYIFIAGKTEKRGFNGTKWLNLLNNDVSQFLADRGLSNLATQPINRPAPNNL